MLSRRPFQCPPALLARARSAQPVRTAIANAGADLPLESTRLAVDSGLMEPVLVGDRDAIAAAADRIGWDIGDFEIVEASDEASAGMTAAKLCGDGAADALMKGHIHTDAFVRGILSRESGLRTGRRLTHVFHMTVPDDDKALLITDAAINVAPDIETRLQAAANAVDLAIALGIETPKVAVLSASEEATETMPSTLDAAEITARAVSEIPNASVFGPLAFDNAVSPEAAALKGIDHPVAGHADILLVPTIETGNALFKMMVYFMSACAAGIVMGAKVPAILTSRADPPEARLASAAIASILAQRA